MVMLRPEALSIIVSFNTGMIIGAGIAWALVMYRWEPIEADEDREDYNLM